MRVIKGDLIELAKNGAFDVIIHGCNCYCKMGKGIALDIKKTFPPAYIADCQTLAGDKGKLGSYSKSDIELGGVRFTIVNAYTQYHWRGAGIKTDYAAISNVMKRVKKDFAGQRIGYPRIGAGLAGGDWNLISQIINNELRGEDHTLVDFVKPK